MHIKNLTIIGTSHIAKQSIEEIVSTIDSLKPDILAVELDRQRYEGLLSGAKHKPTFRDIKRFGVKGFLFASLGAWAEKKLGQQVGVVPGAEMKKAIEIARQNSIKLALIDDDIENILKKISSSLKWREKFNFLADIFKAIFKREKIKFDLNKVPEKELIKKMLGVVKKRYPSIYRVLIVDRNKIMANRLMNLMEQNPDKKILAVVGAGHEEGIVRMIRNA